MRASSTAISRRYPGYYLTGDGGYRDEDGYLFVMGRTDDVINVAGHRLSTGAIEAVLASHPAVAECAVIGVADALKGQLPRGLVVVKEGHDVAPEALQAELVALVRAEIGAVVSLRQVDVVAALPKTRSGKVLRKTMREIADGRPGAVPSTIEDPAVIEDLRPVLTALRRRVARRAADQVRLALWRSSRCAPTPPTRTATRIAPSRDRRPVGHAGRAGRCSAS